MPAAAATTTTAAGSVTYTVNYTCTVGCGTPYPVFVHRYTATIDCAGLMTGTGVAVSDSLTTEKFDGSIVYDATSKTTQFQYGALYTGSNPGYLITASGSVDPLTGALVGLASAQSGAQRFSVTANRGAYTPAQCSTPPVTPPVVTPPVVTPPVVTPPAATGDQTGAQEGSSSEVDDNEVAGRTTPEDSAPETHKPTPTAVTEVDHQVVEKKEPAKTAASDTHAKATKHSEKDSEGEHEG